MHTYRKEDQIFSVGYYQQPSGAWIQIRWFAVEIHAALYVNFLNGGDMAGYILDDLIGGEKR